MKRYCIIFLIACSKYARLHFLSWQMKHRATFSWCSVDSEHLEHWGPQHSLVAKDPLLRCSGPCSKTSLFSSNLGFGICSYVHFFHYGWGIGFVCLCGLLQKVVARCPVVRCQSMLRSAVAVFRKERVCRLRTDKGSTALWTGISASR